MQGQYRIDADKLFDYVKQLEELYNGFPEKKPMSEMVTKNCGYYNDELLSAVKNVAEMQKQMRTLIYNIKTYMREIVKNVNENDEKATNILKN